MLVICLTLLVSCARTGFLAPPVADGAVPWPETPSVDGGSGEAAVVDAAAGDCEALDRVDLDRQPVDQLSIDQPPADASADVPPTPDGSPSDQGQPDRTAVDGAPLDGAVEDARLQDATPPDGTGPDTYLPDTRLPDSATTDAAGPTRAGRLAINAGASYASDVAVTLQIEEPDNLLLPGGVPDDLANWTITGNGGDGWVMEGSSPFGESAFTTSYAGCFRERLIDLQALGLSTAALDAQPTIALREWVVGVWPQYDDLYFVRIELRERRNGGVLASYEHGTQQAALRATASWQPIGQTFRNYGPGLRFLFIADAGQDSEYWAGYYGTRFGAIALHLGELEMRLSNDGVSWTAWQTFAPELAWPLSDATPTLHTVHVEFRNATTVLGQASDSIAFCAPACDANAGCVDQGSSFACRCNTGYSGDGYSCTPN